MPNHTDTRAYFVGEPKDIERMKSAMRQASLLEAIESAKARGASVDLGDWSELKEGSYGVCRETQGSFGLIPEGGLQTPFTLKAGKAMPPSLSGEEGSVSALGDELISGAWEKYKRYPHTQWLSAASSREEAIELAKTHAPEALAAGELRQKNLREHGARGWYEWSIQNWGTKWDAYESRWGKVSSKGRVQEVSFETAWSPPLPGLQALCEKFNLGCAVGYVDEGGGFASLTVFRQDGSIEEDIEDYRSKQRALWPRVRAEARVLAKDLAEKLKAAPGSIKTRKKPAPARGWATRMAAGEEPRGEAIDPAAPGEGGGSPAERFMETLGEGGPMSSPLAGRWLSALSEAGAISPSDAIGDCALGEALSALCWREGFLWAMGAAGAQERQQLAKRALASAILSNAPAVALDAYALIDEAWRPAPELINFYARPEAYCAIALSPAVSDERFEDFYASAMERSVERVLERHAKALESLAVRYESVQIAKSTRLAARAIARPTL